MKRCLLLIPLLPGLAFAEDAVQVHGFVSQGYVVTHGNAYFTPDTEDRGSLDFREVALTASAQPIERTWVGIQVMGRELGDIHTNDITIDWAFGQYTLPTGSLGWETSVRVGRIKTGHALNNDFRDLDLSRTTVFLPEVIYWTTWRDLYVATNGVGATAQSPTGAAGQLTLNAFYGSQRFRADEGAFADAYATYHGEHAKRITIGAQYGAQATWETPIPGLRTKFSWMGAGDWKATWDEIDAVDSSVGLDFRYWKTDETYNEFVVSFEFERSDWKLVGEASYWDERSTDTYSYFDGVSAALYETRWRDHGNAAYGTLSWAFHPSWEAAITAQWMIERYADDLGIESNERTFAYGLALRWSITDHWLIKIEGMIADGGNWLRAQDQTDGIIQDKWSMLALRSTFDF